MSEYLTWSTEEISKIPDTWIKIETEKFPIVDGEEDEIFNDGTYGKALCKYLQRQLSKRDIEVVRFLAEDWGWWFEAKVGNILLPLQIYSDSEAQENPHAYAIKSNIEKDAIWSWKKFRKVNVSAEITELLDSLEALFKADPEVSSVERYDDYPL